MFTIERRYRRRAGRVDLAVEAGPVRGFGRALN
jgi:hypothetical protein